ncbi:MAG: PLDc N-terminal domain-containing protein [Anaerolineaceae bacterium]|nr:PLDc N-terminal domain-containing protein [Anaerolineaceae bacterium]
MIMNSGFNMLGYLATSILSILVVLGWIVLSIVCMCRLRDRKLSAIPKAIWALVIAAIPWLGAIAFLIVKPEEIE